MGPRWRVVSCVFLAARVGTGAAKSATWSREEVLTTSPQDAGALDTRFPGGSVVFDAARVRARSAWLASSDRRPHVAITCPQNSACTLFAAILCVLLEADACRLDSVHGGPAWEVPANKTYVFKSTFNGMRADQFIEARRGWARASGSTNLLHTALAQPSTFTHRVAWFNDPIDKYHSLVHKPWCNNVGGFENKLDADDLAFRSIYEHRFDTYFDAVLFDRDAYERPLVGGPSGGPLDALLDALGLVDPWIRRTVGDASRGASLLRFYEQRSGDVADAVPGGLGRVWTDRNSAIVPSARTFVGNIHWGPLEFANQSEYFCAVAGRVRRTLPALFHNYHPDFDPAIDCPAGVGDAPLPGSYCY